MLFAVFALDKSGSADTRKAVHADHVTHLKKAADYTVTLTTGGPLVDDGGSASLGSLMLIEAPDRAAVEKFNRDGPLQAVWGQVEIRSRSGRGRHFPRAREKFFYHSEARPKGRGRRSAPWQIPPRILSSPSPISVSGSKKRWNVEATIEQQRLSPVSKAVKMR